jgi:hypothetical protein
MNLHELSWMKPQGDLGLWFAMSLIGLAYLLT